LYKNPSQSEFSEDVLIPMPEVIWWDHLGQSVSVEEKLKWNAFLNNIPIRFGGWERRSLSLNMCKNVSLEKMQGTVTQPPMPVLNFLLLGKTVWFLLKNRLVKKYFCKL
jgi:hypothetical protein